MKPARVLIELTRIEICHERPPCSFITFVLIELTRIEMIEHESNRLIQPVLIELTRIEICQDLRLPA